MEETLDDDERLRRVCLLFNNHDLYAPYRTLRLMLCECGVTDPDATQCVIRYYLELDALWWRASTRLRATFHLSDECVRRVFRFSDVGWLMRFLQGDAVIYMKETQVTGVSMRVRSNECDVDRSYRLEMRVTTRFTSRLLTWLCMGWLKATRVTRR